MFKKGGHVRFTFIRMYSVAEMAQQVPRLFTYPFIEPLTYFELCRELPDHDSTIRWCQTMKLLPSSKTCSCGRAMNLVKRKSSPEERGWRCPRKGCLKEVALRKGMFFEGMYESFLTRYVN